MKKWEKAQGRRKVGRDMSVTVTINNVRSEIIRTKRDDKRI
jgi:hypothetical protein